MSKAYSLYNDALKSIALTDSSVVKMKIHTNLGLLYRFYGHYDAAIASYESALNLSEDLSLTQQSDLYYNLGVALKLKGDSVSFFGAEEAFTTSIELAKKIDYHHNIASVNNQIGLMYKAIGDYDMSRIAYENTISTYESAADMREYVGKAYHGIGVTYMDEGKYEQSVMAFKNALKHKKNSGSIFITKYDMGSVMMTSGKTEDAIGTWKEALDEKHNKNDREQVQIYADLTKALAARKDYKEALNYASVFNTNVNSILAEGEKYKSQKQ